MSAFIEQINFDVLIERDINILLLEETRLSQAFQSWLVSKLTNNATQIKRFIRTTHLATNPNVGSVDISFLFETTENKRYVFLIENKMDRPQEPVIARPYFDFGEQGIYDGEWDEYLTCLLAPKNYFEKLTEKEYFSSYLSYEDLADWFSQARQTDSSLPPHRAEYKEVLVRFALGQWNNIVQGLPPAKQINHGAQRSSTPPVAPTMTASHSSVSHKSRKARTSFSEASATVKKRTQRTDAILDVPSFSSPAPLQQAYAPTQPSVQTEPAYVAPYPQQQPYPAEQSLPPARLPMQQVPVEASFVPQQSVYENNMPENTAVGADNAPDATSSENFSDFKLFPAGMLNLPPDYDEKKDSVMNVFTHDYQLFAQENHAFLNIQPNTAVTEKEQIVEFIPAEFAEGTKIVHRLTQNAVDLVFSGTPLSAVEKVYRPFIDNDVSFKETGNCAVIHINAPNIDPQRGLDSQKDLVSFALSKASKLYGLYLRATGLAPATGNSTQTPSLRTDNLFF